MANKTFFPLNNWISQFNAYCCYHRETQDSCNMSNCHDALIIEMKNPFECLCPFSLCPAHLISSFFFFNRHRQNHMKRRYDTERQIIIQHGTRPVGSLRELLDESEATGTGSGVPLLVCASFMCFSSSLLNWSRSLT